MNHLYDSRVQFTTHIDAAAINKGRNRKNAAPSKDWRDVLIILAVAWPIFAIMGWIAWTVVADLFR